MADPFYRWNPIRHGYYPQVNTQPLSAKPKVVNIPVHFVGSDNEVRKQLSVPVPARASTVTKSRSRVDAAVVIQRAVRGFLGRKNVRVVRQIEADVDEIERKVREEEVKIRLEPRERLRVSEELMALLLRLDSVRGVRNFRKKVIQRVIGLQEAIDAISVVGDGEISTNGTAKDRETSMCEGTDESSIVHDQTLDLQENNTVEIPAAVESPKGKSDLIVVDDGTISTTGVTGDQEGLKSEANESCVANVKAEDRSLGVEVEMHKTEMELEKESRAEVESPKRKCDLIGNGIEEEGPRPTDSGMKNADVDKELMVVEPSDEVTGLREILERMAVENESLKMMVSQLCEASAEQCRIMECLADRVSHLERATHRNERRKKRRSGAACSAFSSAK